MDITLNVEDVLVGALADSSSSSSSSEVSSASVTPLVHSGFLHAEAQAFQGCISLVSPDLFLSLLS